MKCSEGPYQGCISLMVKINAYAFKPINGKTRPFSEETFLNAYVNDYYESKPMRNKTKGVCKTTNSKYERVD